MSEAEFCPKCGTKMLPGKEPLMIKGACVGTYSALSCPNCKYFYFIEEDYDLALTAARSLGLVGPTLPSLKPLIVQAPMISLSSEVGAANSVGRQRSLTMNAGPSNKVDLQTERLLA